MIEAQQLYKTYQGRTVVNNVSFTVRKNETFVLLGTSGSGKTTALKILNRLVEPDSGRVLIDGKDTLLEKPEILRRSIGYVLQRSSLFPHYTVFQNIAVVPNLLHWDKNKTRDRAEELMHKLHLPVNYLQVYPQQLSGGEAQRVNLARALMANPPILLMDEPFSALDILTRKSIRNEFETLDELKNKTIAMVTHDVQEAFEMGDRICLINNGTIVQQGKPKELLQTPATDFVKSFLADNYFSLNLSTISLGDLWDYFPAVSLHSKTIEISTAAPVATIILQSKNEDTNSTAIVIRNASGDIKTTDWAGVLQAFSHYKRQNP